MTSPLQRHTETQVGENVKVRTGSRVLGNMEPCIINSCIVLSLFSVMNELTTLM